MAGSLSGPRHQLGCCGGGKRQPAGGWPEVSTETGTTTSAGRRATVVAGLERSVAQPLIDGEHGVAAMQEHPAPAHPYLAFRNGLAGGERS